ncbi:MAG TPA: type VII secretion target, partial [Streptosporangiaceae bacterium]|nr:type VII secretion target [Streptosporangiaceae bacterium]
MSGGSYRGTAVPPVGGISYHGYMPPANWQDPAVSGKDLMVHRDVLREVASQISALAGELQGVIGAWEGSAASAASSGAVGAWPEAQQFAGVIGRSHAGFGQYSGELRQAHSDTATRITISAERYDATEQANVSLATASHD